MSYSTSLEFPAGAIVVIRDDGTGDTFTESGGT